MDTTPCGDEWNARQPGANPSCHLPTGHDGDHKGDDGYGYTWDWSYHPTTP